MLRTITSLGWMLVVTLFGTPAWAGQAQIWNSVVHYTEGTPGETNDVTISIGGSNYYIRDTGAGVVPGPGCSRVDLLTARCPSMSITGLYASLGDGDDRLTNSTATGINAQGGDGRDILTGGWGNDTLLGQRLEDDLYGGPGNDILLGGSEDDYLDGGADNDYMAGESGANKLIGGAGDDIIDGGEGRVHPFGWWRWHDQYNILTYESVAVGPVSVRLYLTTQQDTGSAGKDTISNIQILYGTAVGDTLAGKDYYYELYGGDGDDKLYSYGTISSYPGELARSYGGQGNDTFDVVQPTTASFKLYGGPGRDRLLGGDGTDHMYGESDPHFPWNGVEVDYFDGRGGDDLIYANDGLGEYVVCGDGMRDSARFDALDVPTMIGCEIQNPPP